VTLENAACHNRYHAALFRTALVGKTADDKARRMRDACIEGLEKGLAAFKPGNTVADVHNAVQATVDARGFTDNFRKRAGYSIGIAFAPDWGECNVLNIYRNVTMALRPGMTFHMPVSLCDHGRFTTCASETIVVTETGCRVLSDVPRALF
jgi:Xaa-Pro dipeptidase